MKVGLYEECRGSKGGIYFFAVFWSFLNIFISFLSFSTWRVFVVVPNFVTFLLIPFSRSYPFDVIDQNFNMHPPQHLLLPIFLTIAFAAHTTPPPLPFTTPKPLSAHHKYPTFPPAQVAVLAGRIMARPGRLSQLQLLLDNRCECKDGLKCCGSYCECDFGCGEEVVDWECLI